MAKYVKDEDLPKRNATKADIDKLDKAREYEKFYLYNKYKFTKGTTYNVMDYSVDPPTSQLPKLKQLLFSQLQWELMRSDSKYTK
jgi:hypothetical protein